MSASPRNRLGDSGDSSSSGLLCEKCRNIPWDRLQSTGGGGFSYHHNFAELEDSCEWGCQLCQSIYARIVYCGVFPNKAVTIHWSLSRHVTLLYRSGADSTYQWFCGFQDPSPKLGPRALHVKRLAQETLDHDLDILLDNISQWLTACTMSGKHKRCAPLNLSPPSASPLPTRLIDVGPHGKDMLRLIDPQTELPQGSAKPVYLVLTYRWGKGNWSARTTPKNLDQRKKEIVIQELPRTIQDAIKITRRMKIQYLWVDAICIIQPDNDGETDDWRKESLRMAGYYLNAYCCIAASSAEDSSEGILVERQVARFPFREWYNPEGETIRCPHSSRAMFRNPLLERGWCLQEWILSPRILHWTSNGLIWQCREGFFWEGQKGFQGERPEELYKVEDRPARFSNDCMFNTKYDNEASRDFWQILESDKDQALGDDWSLLVHSYSQMNLTNPGDRLAAIQGIATHLSNRHKTGYFAGIFEHRYANGLLWQGARGEELLTKIEGFPSWSWASAMGTIQIPRWNADIEPTVLTTWIGTFPSGDEIQDFTKRPNRAIHMRAPILPLKVTSQNLVLKAFRLRFFEFQFTSPIWPGGGLRIHLDYVEPDSTHLEGAFLLFLRERQVGRQYLEGIVIKRSLLDGDNAYERIGVFDALQGSEEERFKRIDPGQWEEWSDQLVLL